MKVKVNNLIKVFLSFSNIIVFSCSGPQYDILILNGTVYDGSGIDFVIVNGWGAIDNGEFHDVRSGTVLRKK